MFRLGPFSEKLESVVDGEVRFDRGTLTVYSTDSSNYRQIPIGVVIPRHEGDIIRTVALARENHIPILARGGGTSLGGQTTNAALILDFSKYMNSVGTIDAEGRRVVVEPGVVQSQLNRELAPCGLFFAPDPSTKDRCTLGGMIGNNSCGAHSAAYGKTVDNLAALDVLLYDGTRLSLGGAMNGAKLESAISALGREGRLYRDLKELAASCAPMVQNHYPRIPRRVSGYNLDELIAEDGPNLARAVCGSEGTLAITLRATVDLRPLPKNLALVILGFEDVFIAADQTPWLLAHHPEALEGFDHRLPEFARRKGIASVRLLPEGRSFLIVEVAGSTAAEARDRAEDMVREAHRLKAIAGDRVLSDPGEQAAIWALRASGLGASAVIPGYPRTWPGAEDTAVPPEKLGAYLRRFNELLTRHGLHSATFYGHFGEGCVHSRIDFDLQSRTGVETFRTTMEELAALVVEFGGSLSGEHGDGLARSELLSVMFPPPLIEAFRSFKHAFDPDGMMNPGVIVDPHPLDSNLKLGADYSPQRVVTKFDFSADDGLAGAALKCVGIGKCRAVEGGTMCPSYMATREEIHSTRGRARLLFEALSGNALEGGFTDPAIAEALDLCLSCKACKSECPASVDMAKYRAEFFAHYYAERRRPLRDRVFARIHDLARLASIAPSFANAAANSPMLGGVARRMLGIHPDRNLPRLAAETFRSWFQRRGRGNVEGREVLLFPDTFTNLFDPAVGIAAVEVLERAGFRVTIPHRDLCCGRPLYETGMLERARLLLSDAMDVLGPFVDRGTTIVGLEPSCILTFRDELPALFPHCSKARALSERTLMLDEFLLREAPDFIPPTRSAQVIVHGHCHQKAIAGLEATAAILDRVPGLDYEILEAGCCGMAGAFGYHREHFDLSKQIGERALIPAITATPAETIIVADGFSCRSQIRQFCPGHRAVHLAELLNTRAAGTA